MNIDYMTVGFKMLMRLSVACYQHQKHCQTVYVFGHSEIRISEYISNELGGDYRLKALSLGVRTTFDEDTAYIDEIVNWWKEHPKPTPQIHVARPLRPLSLWQRFLAWIDRAALRWVKNHG